MCDLDQFGAGLKRCRRLNLGQSWVYPVIEAITVAQACGTHLFRMIGIHAIRSKVHPHIISQPLRVEYLECTIRCQCAGTAMNDPAIESNTIARRHFPADHPESIPI